MWAVLRLIRASWAFGIILASYLLQLGLQRVLGKRRVARRWERLHQRNARRLYRGIVRLRGVYIKMGQVLSIMGTFLPAAYVRELERLQDQVPARPWRHIRRAIRKSLGHEPDTLFAKISQRPVAAASLGQVHAATTHEGERVAVKVLYPNVSTIIRIDLRVIGWAMVVYRWFVPIGQIDRFLDQLRDLLERETDFAHEARCIDRMAAAFDDDPDVLFPVVLPALSSREVLTMTFMDGVKISNRDALDALGLNPDDVAAKLVRMFYKQVFLDRFFHADPHPGNFFVQRGPEGQVRIVVLDLGSASEVRDNLVDGMLQVLSGYMTRDDTLLLRGIETMGFVAEDGDRELLESTIRRYFEKLLNLDLRDLSRIDPEVAQELLDPGLKRREIRALMRAFQYPLGWFYVERAAIILFGLSAQLAPRLNTIEIGLPYVLALIAKNPLPRAPRPEEAPVEVAPVAAAVASP